MTVDEPGTELELRDAPLPALVPEPTAADLVQRLAVIKEAMQVAMVPDVDYGVIPGTGAKPALLKPGSEKLGVLFQLDIQLENEKLWHDDGHLTVVAKAVAYHAPSGTRLGSGEGLCSTREAKYAYRNESRKCPACGVAAIIKGKAEYGGGWVCFKKKDGCGAKFADDDVSITGQAQGKVPNPDLADSYNTVDKMASKRARIDCVLAVTGASALFTQDVESQDAAPADAQRPAAGNAGKAATAAPGAAPTDKPARSWSEWTDRMEALGVVEPNLWLKSAVKALYGKESLADLTVAKRDAAFKQANYVLLQLVERPLSPPEEVLGYVSEESLAEVFSQGFGGVVVEVPAEFVIADEAIVGPEQDGQTVIA